MQCFGCEQEKSPSDFLDNKNICYQCMYQIKKEKLKNNPLKKGKFCRICSEELIMDKNKKHKQRTVFCSDTCAKKGQRQQVMNYWIRKILT